MNYAIPPGLDRTRLVGSYSMLAAYKNCAHAMARRYVVKDIPYSETPEMAWGNKVHKAFELRIGGDKPLPVEMQQWEPLAAVYNERKAQVERKLGVAWNMQSVDYWDKEVWFRGKIDVSLVNGTKAYICDWKTGNSKYEDPLELRTGAVLLKARHPQLEQIFGNYVWLKDNRVGERYDLSDITSTWVEIKELMSEIEERKKSGEWEKVKSALCSRCSVRDCENWRERK